MIKYFKKNKVFVLLFVCLLFINGVLLLQATGANTMVMYEEPSEYSPYTTTFKLNGDFDEQAREVTLSWTLPSSREKVKNIVLYYNNEPIETVTNQYSIRLPLSTYGINTGNANFKLIVTYEDDSAIEKNIYVYINEVFDIQVSSKLEEGKVVYYVTYWYAKNNPSSVPRLNYNSNVLFDISYKESKVLEEDSAYQKKMSTYELLLNNVSNGKYELDMEWIFIDYDNISYSYYSVFEVKGATTNENN